MRYLNIDQILRFVWLTLVVLCVTLWTSGCETTRETRTERETVTVEDVDRDNIDDGVDDTPLTESTVTDEERTVTTEREGEGGILGGTFHLIGEILAFPFRVIAGILDFIF